VIYNSTPDSWNSQASLYPGSQKFQTIYRSLQSLPHSRPSQCTFIMLLLVTTQHTCLLIGINKQKLHSTKIYGSLTYRRCFSYLANSKAASSRVGVTELSFPVFRDIHLAPKTFVIYNSILTQFYDLLFPGWRYYKSCTQNFRDLQFYHIHLAPKTFMVYNSSSSQASLYLGSQMFQSIYHSLPSLLPSCPSQCTLIMLLLVTTQHTCLGAQPTTLPFHISQFYGPEFLAWHYQTLIPRVS
jgi:hypothetical protein